MPQSTTKTAAERSQQYAIKKKENGMVRRAYWVPENKQTEAKKAIENLTNED